RSLLPARLTRRTVEGGDDDEAGKPSSHWCGHAAGRGHSDCGTDCRCRRKGAIVDLIVQNLELIAFYAFAGLCLASALAVISVRNTVHAALFLVLTFFSAACTWVLARAEFLGIVLVLVYVGAVMVLFL